MSRIVLVLCLALLVALSFGCAKKEKTPEGEKTAAKAEVAGMVSPSFDPVSMEEIDVMSTPYSYELDGVIYYFSSAENMEAFKANPQKYIAAIKGEAAPSAGE